MSKVYPAEKRLIEPPQRRRILGPTPSPSPSPSPSVLTVWKKSSMSFQGTDGFTVFDHRGRLAFRVDNYTRKSWSGGGGGLLLMDGSGKALLTLKPQLLSIQNQWNAYRGEDEDTCTTRAFSMRRPSSALLIHRGSTSSSASCEAEVFLGEHAATDGPRKPDLKSEGSFRRRSCKIVSGTQLVAVISRKRINTTLLLSDDVFTLTVQPGFDPTLAMAFVVILDRICCKPLLVPILCS